MSREGLFCIADHRVHIVHLAHIIGARHCFLLHLSPAHFNQHVGAVGDIQEVEDTEDLAGGVALEVLVPDQQDRVVFVVCQPAHSSVLPDHSLVHQELVPCLGLVCKGDRLNLTPRVQSKQKTHHYLATPIFPALLSGEPLNA